MDNAFTIYYLFFIIANLLLLPAYLNQISGCRAVPSHPSQLSHPPYR